MTELEASKLLLSYPGRWAAQQARREQILESYHASSDLRGAWTRNHGVSNPTARRAGKLLEIGAQDPIVEAVKQWLATGPDQKDRLILIGLWRGLSVQAVARRYRAWDIHERWQRMTQGLTRSVGAVCGEHGSACANIPKSYRRG